MATKLEVQEGKQCALEVCLPSVLRLALEYSLNNFGHKVVVKPDE